MRRERLPHCGQLDGGRLGTKRGSRESRTVVRGTPSRRAISQSLTPAATRRSASVRVSTVLTNTCSHPSRTDETARDPAGAGVSGGRTTAAESPPLRVVANGGTGAVRRGRRGESSPYGDVAQAARARQLTS